MNNQWILELLQKAQATSSQREQNDILAEFNQALFDKSHRRLADQEVKLCFNCLSQLLNCLFLGYVNRCPDRLIFLLPVLMMLCGDLPTDDSLNKLGEVDWHLCLRIFN